MRFVGRTVLVTGATGGIGRALTVELVRRGNTVIACGRDEGRLRDLRRLVPEADVYRLDLTRPEETRTLADHVARQHGRLDVLINNAAARSADDRLLSDPATSTSISDVEADIATNLTGPICLTLCCLPLLQAGEEALVVNVTSILAVAPIARAPVYCASKAGLAAFGKSLRPKLASAGVRVVDLMPPPVDTALAAGLPVAKMAPARFATLAVNRIEAGDDDIRFGRNRVWAALAELGPRLASRFLV